MSNSKRSHEGYLLIDNRNSPGLSDELVSARQLPVGSGHGLFETPTYTCNHCQVVVVLNPKRTRARQWCGGCDHYICDNCKAIMVKTGKCRTFEQVIEEAQELALKRNGEDHGKKIIVG